MIGGVKQKRKQSKRTALLQAERKKVRAEFENELQEFLMIEKLVMSGAGFNPKLLEMRNSIYHLVRSRQAEFKTEADVTAFIQAAIKDWENAQTLATEQESEKGHVGEESQSGTSQISLSQSPYARDAG